MAVQSRIFCWLWIIVTVLGLSTQVIAEPQEPNKSSDFFDMSLEDLMEVEVDTVQGASRYEQKVTEAPSSITIITAEEIRRYGYRTLADILRSVRGFYTFYDRNYEYVGVRGIGRLGDYNTRILLLLDGIRTNDNVYEQAMIDGDFILDVDLINRVEIIRGPGSSLYGSNAFFAVVNIISKSGSDLKGTEISGSAASYRTFKERVSYGDKFENGMEALVSLSNYDSDGENLYFKEFDDPSTNYGQTRGTDTEEYGNIFSKVSFRDFTLEGAYVSRDKRVPTAPWAVTFNDDRFKTTDGTGLLDLKYNHSFEEILDVMGRIYYGQYRYRGSYPYTSEPLMKDYSKGTWFGGEVQFTKEVLDNHKLIWGAGYQDNQKQYQTSYDETEVYLDDQRDSEQWNVFVQDEYKILSNLILNAGIRYDHYSTFSGSTNPRLGLIYNPFEKTFVKLLYGTAFRAPNAYELYYISADDQKINPDLKPERIKTYKLSLEQYVGKGICVSAAGFVNKMDDLISLVTDQDDGLLVYENFEQVEAKGIEFELDGKWKNGWRGRTSYTFVDTEDKVSGSTLPNSPRHLIKFNLVAPVIKDKLFAGFEAQYTSKVKTLTDNYADDFTVVNLNLTYENLIKNLNISAGCFNLFDKQYYNPGSEEHTQDTIIQPGRTFGVKLTYRF